MYDLNDWDVAQNRHDVCDACGAFLTDEDFANMYCPNCQEPLLSDVDDELIEW